jgi:hypothetical protein
MRKTLLLSAAFLVAAIAPAAAYTAYLMPDDFLPDDRSVSLQATYATTFFTPGLAVGANFAVINPDGSDGFYSQIEVAGQATNLRTALYDEGTYRFTTGEQLGQVVNMVGENGAWRQLGQGETPAEGAQTTTLQTVTVADVYVTLGAPTRQAVDRTIGRLSLRPVTHPNQVLVGQGFQVQAQFDGAPFANAALVLYKAGEPEGDLDRFFTTDASGNATLTLDEPRQYIVVARHRANAPAGSQAQVQSFTTSLVFEAFTALPPVVQLADEADQADDNRRRRRGGAGNRF